MGIRRLSEVCFGFGVFLMLIVFFMDKTFYILNLLVQSLGYYAQFILQVGWHTDAFEQLGPSAHQELGRFVPPKVDQALPDGPENWIDEWTMFYWGWWISWSPFVGKTLVIFWSYFGHILVRFWSYFVQISFRLRSD